MSRSYRKRPYGSYYCYSSEKEWKRSNNRLMRRIVNQRLHKWGETDVDLLLPVVDEIANVWNSPSEGKSWRGDFVNDGWYTPFEFYKAVLAK